jgi:malonyl-CoA O-methyltransferase
MKTSPETIRRQFTRSANGLYDAHAAVQRDMASRLAASLHERKNESVAARLDMLEIGCGTGVLTEMLVRDWPFASITALDIAPAMLETAEKRVGNGRVRFLAADAESWPADAEQGSFDLIVSSACFQWLRRPAETLRRLRRLLRPGGMLAFATFGPQTFRELHLAFEAVYRDRGKPPQRHGLSFQTAEQWQSMLMETGYERARCERSLQIMTYASAREFLHSIKAVGASATEAAGSRGLGSRQLFAGMFREYEAKFSISGGVTATYELLQFHASVDQACQYFVG